MSDKYPIVVKELTGIRLKYFIYLFNKYHQGFIQIYKVQIIDTGEDICEDVDYEDQIYRFDYLVYYHGGKYIINKEVVLQWKNKTPIEDAIF